MDVFLHSHHDNRRVTSAVNQLSRGSKGNRGWFHFSHVTCSVTSFLPRWTVTMRNGVDSRPHRPSWSWPLQCNVPVVSHNVQNDAVVQLRRHFHCHTDTKVPVFPYGWAGQHVFYVTLSGTNVQLRVKDPQFRQNSSPDGSGTQNQIDFTMDFFAFCCVCVFLCVCGYVCVSGSTKLHFLCISTGA